MPELDLDKPASVRWDGYPELAWERDSLAVVACDGHGNGAVLWTVGPHIRFEIHEAGFRCLGDLGLDDAPRGVSVWTGRVRYVGGDGDVEAVTEGAFRAPTDVEWLAILTNENPWNDQEWRKE